VKQKDWILILECRVEPWVIKLKVVILNDAITKLYSHPSIAKARYWPSATSVTIRGIALSNEGADRGGIATSRVCAEYLDVGTAASSNAHEKVLSSITVPVTQTWNDISGPVCVRINSVASGRTIPSRHGGYSGGRISCRYARKVPSRE
jgi:hypothetical protein